MRKRMTVAVLLLAAACAAPPPAPPPPAPPDDRAKFGNEVAALLLDTHLHELKGALHVATPSTDPHEESPVEQRDVPHPAAPGPHSMNGVMYADVEVLRKLLGTEKNAYILLLGHRHGETLYVPVKLFAREFGAYVRITSTLATLATVWPRASLEHLRKVGDPRAPVLLEARAEGLL
jgi:hypothetical protein